MVGESGVRQLVMVVVVVLMMASANAAFIDKRPKMPRVSCSHYIRGLNDVEEMEECKREEDEDTMPVDFFCQTTWQNESGTGHSTGLKVLRQSCIPVYSDHGSESAQHKQCVNKAQCVDHRQAGEGKGDKGDVLFCCCHGDGCNSVFSWEPRIPNPEPIPPIPEIAPQLSPALLVLYTIVPLLVIAVIIGASCYVYQHRKHARFSSLSSSREELPASPPTPTLTHRPVELLEIKARGRFGAVWKGQVAKEMVAVKIFPLQDKQSWFAEQEIYNLAQLSHDNILQFLGVDKRGEGLQVEFWLVTSFHEHGSLCDFLKNNVLTVQDLIKICLTMAKGLAHLHGELGANKGQGLKPAIAHRDFKSKNVLIKSDMTACIGDFGLALQFRPGEVVGDTHGQVGTRRYMAPEVLEGAINFSRDAFLRIDMYACGLVLWEVASRTNLAEAPAAQPYRLPFEAEASPHPSLEEICELVVTKKVRPALPQGWRKHPGLAVLCETIEESWDHDAEARLSSSCVVERLQQMRLLSTGSCAPAPLSLPALPPRSPPSRATHPEQVCLLPLNPTNSSTLT